MMYCADQIGVKYGEYVKDHRVLAEALKQRGLWALGRVVMSGHRYGVVIRCASDLLSVHFLHEPAQVRLAATYAAQLRAETVSPEDGSET